MLQLSPTIQIWQFYDWSRAIAFRLFGGPYCKFCWKTKIDCVSLIRTVLVWTNKFRGLSIFISIYIEVRRLLLVIYSVGCFRFNASPELQWKEWEIFSNVVDESRVKFRVICRPIVAWGQKRRCRKDRIAFLTIRIAVDTVNTAFTCLLQC